MGQENPRKPRLEIRYVVPGSPSDDPEGAPEVPRGPLGLVRTPDKVGE